MKSRIIRKYLISIFIYTVVYALFLLVMDFIFNGILTDFFEKNLPGSIFYLLYSNKMISVMVMYAIGVFIISLLQILKLEKILNIAEKSIDNDNGEEYPEELKNFGNKLKDFKEQIKNNEFLRKQAEQQKNDLVVYLAHDLKTPLTSVIGYLSLLKESPELSFEQRSKYTGIALDKAYRLEQLINEFFDITRLNLQTVITQKKELNLSILLMQIISEFYPMLEEKAMQATGNIPPDIKISGDVDKLARAFDNLLKNAVSYGYENSQITVTAGISGDNVSITIKNRGDKIPPEMLSHIFDKFYRLDSARRSNTGGAGLGLAIAKQIIELHSGSIEVSSDDDFTSFKVILPTLS